MGAACCTAAKDRTIVNGPHGEGLQRHAHYSPSWSFRWENRGRVAGEDTHANWLREGGGGSDQGETKSSTTVETAFSSEEGSRLDSFQSIRCQKLPVSEGNAGTLRLPASDQTVSRTLVEVKESTEPSSVSHSFPLKPSPTAPSGSFESTSPLHSQSRLLPPNLTPSRWHHRSPGHQPLRQVSDSLVPEYKSPSLSISEDASLFLPPAWGNESTRGSNGASSDGWSIPVFSELMTTRRERWSFDSDNSGFSRENIARSSGRSSMLPSVDLQTCGVCMKLLIERSSWGWRSQKMISTNELAVVSVLTCGHVYHAECLENMTTEVNKYDPPCPVCTYGEKQAAKMSEKAMKAEMDMKARKRSRKRVIDINLDSDVVIDHHKGGEEKGLRTSSSKRSIGKPFLNRHFSFSSKASTSLSENQSARRKGFFWARSNKG